jgi:hypothetical protein
MGRRDIARLFVGQGGAMWIYLMRMWYQISDTRKLEYFPAVDKDEPRALLWGQSFAKTLSLYF